MQHDFLTQMLQTFKKHSYTQHTDFSMLPFFSLCVLNIHRRILLFCSITAFHSCKTNCRCSIMVTRAKRQICINRVEILFSFSPNEYLQLLMHSWKKSSRVWCLQFAGIWFHVSRAGAAATLTQTLVQLWALPLHQHGCEHGPGERVHWRLSPGNA